MGRNRLSRFPRAVEKALLRPQCGQLWLGRRHDSEHSLALQNGELDGVSPKVIVLQAGTNNLPATGSADNTKVDEVVTGIKAIIGVCQQQAPSAAVVLTGVFPRSQNTSLKEAIEQINTQLKKLDDGKRIRFLNINDRLADREGKLLPGISKDGLHLEAKGYDIWAEALSRS